jgi:hypothetical protein
MSNKDLISNMKYRRRFNEISKESFKDVIPNNHDANPTFIYALKLFILAYLLMIGINVIYYCVVFIKKNLAGGIEEQNSPTTPTRVKLNLQSTSPPPTPKKGKPNFRPVTRSMAARRRKTGLNLFA